MKKLSKKKIIIISIVSLVLVAAVAITSVILIKKRHETYDPVVEDATDNYDKNYINPELAEDVFALDYFEPQPIKQNKKLNSVVKADTAAFIKTLSAKSTDFSYSDCFDTASQLKKQKVKPKISKHKYDVTDGTGLIDEQKLYESVIQNNKAYIDSFKNKDDSIDMSMQLYEELPDKQIRFACRYITKYVNKAKQSKYWQDVDFNCIFCNLAKLRIMHSLSAGFALAYVDEDGILSINDEAIENKKSFLPFDTEGMSDKEMEQYLWNTTTVHEIMHLLQSTCSCIERKDEFMLGNMCMPVKLDSSPLVDKWLAEASAEMEMANMLGIDTVTYPNYINYYYLMLTSYILDPEVSPRKILRLNYDKDNFPFYKAFGKLDKAQTIELLNALFSIEVLSYKPKEFVNAYEKKTGVNLLEQEDKAELVNQNLRLNALKYFTKTFYLSLARQVEKGKMSYNDMFYIIRQFERALYEHMSYNEEDRLMTSNTFFDEYLSIQDAFFEAIANDELSKTDLCNAYNEYAPKCKAGNKVTDNFDFSWMNSEQAYALKKIENNYYTINLPTIREVKALYLKNGYDKSLKY